MCEAAGVRAAQESQRPYRDYLSPCCPFPPGPPRDPTAPSPQASSICQLRSRTRERSTGSPSARPPRRMWTPVLLACPQPLGRTQHLFTSSPNIPNTPLHLQESSRSSGVRREGAATLSHRSVGPKGLARGTWQGWGNSQRDRRANSTLSSPALFPLNPHTRGLEVHPTGADQLPGQTR